MALQHTAQGLASLGRHGDSVLVHMQPEEVAGLQALAQSQGTSLTINPATGMPEAFRLGDFFKSLLPTLVGGAASMIPGLQFASMPLLTGILAGSATGALTNKDDPLMGALMGGLGGYGGAGMMKAGQTAAGAMGSAGGYSGGATPADQILANAPSAPGMNPNLQSQIMPSFMTNNAGAASMLPNETFLGNVGNAFKGMAGAATGNQAAIDAYAKAMGTETGLGAFGKSMLPVGGAVLSGLEPSDLGYGGPSINDLQRKTKYRGPLGQLNLDANYNQDTGEYEGLPSLQLATGGPVDLNSPEGGGISDLYNRPEGATAESISNDGYGMGRLDKLAQQGSLTKAADMFYAAGGPVSFADGGDTESSMNLDSMPALNLNTGKQSMGGLNSGTTLYGLPELIRDALSRNSAGFKEQYPTGIGFSELRKNTELNAEAAGLNPRGLPMSYLLSAFKAQKEGNQGPKLYALNLESGKQEAQYASGGYLDGPGDGLSDSIPATIEGKQPARLADGEFVVSSDVVSGLGNGSSKAGAKKLYAMMDRVRQQAHGTKKQIRKVNEKKVMPDLA